MKKRGRFKFSPGLAFINFVQLCHTFETIAKFCCYNNNNNNNNDYLNYYYNYYHVIIVPVSVDTTLIYSTDCLTE